MKICFITPSIFNLGGVQRVVSLLASELVKNYEVDVICTCQDYDINRELYNLDERVNIVFNDKLIKRNFYQKVKRKICKIINKILNDYKLELEILYPSFIRDRIKKYLNYQKYDIVIGVEGDYSILLSLIADEINSKTIGWMHNSFDAYFETKNKYYWGQKNIFKNNLKKLDKCIVLTKEDRRLYKEEFGVEVDYIYNPLSFTTESKSNCLNKNILFVGRLIKEQKGLDYLMEIFKDVSVNNLGWNLIIVGDGQDKDYLENYIEKYNLSERVKIFAHTNKIIEFYLNASIFISTSRWEGFGLVVTEAMECGLPVIAFNNSGPREIINKSNHNGIIIEKYDLEAFKEALKDLIDSYELRKKISKNSITRANDFNKENIIKKWREMFCEL